MIRILSFVLLMLLMAAGAVSAQGKLQLLSPNGGESFEPGDTVEVRWSGGGNGMLRLQYSADSGKVWRHITDSAVGGSYHWVVPNTPSTTCLLRALRITDDSSVVTLNGEPSLSTWPWDYGAYADWNPRPSFSPDGDRVVTLSKARDGALIWDARSGVLLLKITPVIDWHKAFFFPRAVFSPDGWRVAITCQDRTVLHNANNGDSLAALMGANGPLIFSHDGRFLVTYVGGRRELVIWDMSNYSPVDTIKALGGGAAAIDVSVDFRLMVAGASNEARVYDIATGTQVRGYTHSSQPVTSVALSPDGARTSAGTWWSAIRQWNNLTGDLLSTIYGPSPPYSVNTERYSVDGGHILAVIGGRIMVFNRAGDRLLRLIGEEYTTDKYMVANFSADGYRCAIVYPDGIGRIWTIEHEEDADTSDAAFTIRHMPFSCADIDFGRVKYVSGAAAARLANFVFINNGKLPITIRSVNKEGPDGEDFALQYSGGIPFTVWPGVPYKQTVQFKPRDFGQREAQYSFYTDVDTIRVAVRGIGALQPLEPALPIVLFPGVAVGTSMDTTVKLLRNVDTIAWQVSVSIVESPDSMQFSVIAPTDTLTVLPGDSLSVTIRYHPTMLNREYRQKIRFSYNGLESPVEIALVGNSRAVDVPELSLPLHGASLSHAVPDPASGVVRFNCEIVEACHLRLSLFDDQGRRVMMLLDEDRQPGNYSINTDVSDLPAGFYYCILETGTEKVIQKLIVVR